MNKDYTIPNLNAEYFANYMYPARGVYDIVEICDDVATISYYDEEAEQSCDDYIAGFNNEQPANILTREKLSKIGKVYRAMAEDFAATNSIMMAQLGYTQEQKQAFVRKAVDAFMPIRKEMEMFSYYDLWDMFDAIERDEILTDDRINDMKSKLATVIFG